MSTATVTNNTTKKTQPREGAARPNSRNTKGGSSVAPTGKSAAQAEGTQQRQPRAVAGGSAQQRTYQNLFVACLPKSLTNPELLSIFSPYGCTSAAVMMDVNTGISKGYGFATFPSEAEGKLAMEALNHTNINVGEHDFSISVSPSKHDSTKVAEESPYVFFRNVPSCFLEGTIKDVFAHYGKIVTHTMRQDGEKDLMLVMIQYETIAEAKTAISACHGKLMFPQVTQVPVMAKFADSNVTRQMQQQNRRPNHPFPKGNSPNGKSNSGSATPTLVHVRNPHRSANASAPTPPMPMSTSQPVPVASQSSAPIAVNSMGPRVGSAELLDGLDYGGTNHSWDNSHGESPAARRNAGSLVSASVEGGSHYGNSHGAHGNSMDRFASGASYHSTGHSHPNQHRGSSHFEREESSGAAVLLPTAGVGSHTNHYGSGHYNQSHGHSHGSCGSSLGARDNVPQGATFRHDPYSSQGYSIASDY